MPPTPPIPTERPLSRERYRSVGRFLLSVLGAGLVLVLRGISASASASDDECWGLRDGCAAGGRLIHARAVAPPAGLTKAVAREITGAWSIDLDSDGKPDFVVEVKGEPTPGSMCFVSSSFELRACEDWNRSMADGFGYWWFAQLDDDPMLELFRMDGDEDWSDYAIQKLDSKTWARKDLFKIDPLIIVDEKNPMRTFWGYPWDIRDLIADSSDGQIRLLTAPPSCAFNEPGEQAGVVIFFTGTPTQGGPSNAFLAQREQAKLLSLAEAAKLFSTKPCPAVGYDR